MEGRRNAGNLRSAFHLYGCGVACPAEQGSGADALQPPLRCGFRARLTAGFMWSIENEGQSYHIGN
jgi:hypothetical protein